MNKSIHRVALCLSGLILPGFAALQEGPSITPAETIERPPSANPSEPTDMTYDHSASQSAADSQSKEVELIPARVANSYESKSNDKGNRATATRTSVGWTLELTAAGRKKGPNRSWAGYCFDLSQIDGRAFEDLVVEFPSVTHPAEIEIKLERRNHEFQDRVLRFPTTPGETISLDAFPTARPEIARVCFMLLGKLGTTEKTRTKFSVSRVSVR